MSLENLTGFGLEGTEGKIQKLNQNVTCSLKSLQISVF